MSIIVEGLYYSRDHEWLRVDGDEAYLGITDHAQDALGDIVFSEGEPEGTALSVGAAAGVVESVKAASDVFTPVSGTVTEVNPALADTPEAINAEPYKTWIVKLSLSNKAELADLMDAKEYAKFCEEGN